MEEIMEGKRRGRPRQMLPNWLMHTASMKEAAQHQEEWHQWMLACPRTENLKNNQSFSRYTFRNMFSKLKLKYIQLENETMQRQKSS